jgi:hypothetical protein
MPQDRDQRARQIQATIRQALLLDWDPIGVQEIPEAHDEYDSYIGGVYRLIASGATEQQVADHLWHIENDTMGLPAPDRDALLLVARKLLSLDVAL